MKRIITATLLLIISQHAFSQQTFPRNGVNDEREKLYVFIHANIWTDYQTMIADATMVIRDGKIEAIGKDIAVPKGAIVTDLQGKFIYPSFIDIYSDYGMPPVTKNQSPGQRGPQFISSKNGAYNWNQAVHPEIHSNELFEVKEDQAKDLRELGFGTVSSHQKDGIVRGTGAIVLLGEEKSNDMVLKDHSAEYYSFNKGVSTQDYPSSLMGSIALVRQTYYDAQWYKSTNGTAETNISLDELNKALQLPQVFEVGDVYSALRADKIGDEFNIKYIIKGAGDEYQRIDDVKATGDAFIVPLNFPVAFDVEDPYDAEQIPLAALMHWEMAPGNPAALEKAGIAIALTSAALKSKNDFFKNLRTAIDYGMSPVAALKALTYTPASLMGVLNQVGTLEKGKLANFIICSDSVFKEKTIIYQNWVKGSQYVVNSYDLKDVRGNYSLTLATLPTLNLQVEGTVTAPEASVKLNDKDKLKATITTVDDLVSISFRYPADTSKSVYRLSGYWKDKNLMGTGQDPRGNWINWSAQFTAAYQEKADTSKKKKEKSKAEGTVLYPFIGYGNPALPKPENFLFKNATVWTNESEGILQNTDVFISNGKIQKVGKNLPVPRDDVKVYDATGKYLTSGIIDEHSHIAAAQGLNEGTQSVTSEVRVGDIITPGDINIYRQLSGGVTAAQILHGSANSIGGQTQLIKLRWGYSPEAMKFQGWPGFIKFALGENVKQSNWGDQNTKRFPQTRMGVEQTMYDAFIRAKDYKASWSQYNSIPAKQKAAAIAPRRDLELDALVEILDGKRFITCHSYVQSEINMLMHVGDSMGFKVNTFTHILEGYKVADKMKARNIYASNFSDWWAYKYEVYDAIPYNSAILNGVGVLTAVNSDDAEMARRLNQEAAKSIKYGGLTEEEAWKLCTLNPAKMLHVDDKVGSIKVGKDADVVLWNNNPLSIYASPEMTLVDGTCFFSLEKDAQHQQWMQQERSRLINKMLQAKKEGVPTQKIKIEFNREWDCESLTDGSKVGN
ncbi:MAG TPA: amidohydrolase family protein [Chitinophagales bacterium]|nr:amidohydrolase family protein [Chitinophagales bacterium]